MHIFCLLLSVLLSEVKGSLSSHHAWEEWAPCYFPSWRGTTRLLCLGSLLQGQGAVTGCKCLPALPSVIPEALLYVISLRNNCLGSTLKFNIDTVMWVPGGLGVNTQTLLLLFYFQLWSPMEEKQLGVLHELSKTLGIIGRLLLHSRGRRKEFSLDCVHSVCWY